MSHESNLIKKVSKCIQIIIYHGNFALNRSKKTRGIVGRWSFIFFIRPLSCAPHALDDDITNNNNKNINSGIKHEALFMYD